MHSTDDSHRWRADDAPDSRSGDGDAPARRQTWTVLTSDTRVLSFASEHELRIAIDAGLVRPEDQLLLPDGPLRNIRDIPELRAEAADRDTWPYGIRTSHSSSALGQVAHADAPPLPPPQPAPSFSPPPRPLTAPPVTEPPPSVRPRSFTRALTAPPPAPPTTPPSPRRALSTPLWFALGGATLGLVTATQLALVMDRSEPTVPSVVRSAQVDGAAFRTAISVADLARREGRFDEAEALLAAADENHPRSPEVLHTRAQLSVDRHDSAWVVDLSLRDLTGAAGVSAGTRRAELLAAVEALAAVAPDHLGLPVLRLHAARAVGDHERARQLAKELAPRKTEPQVAYALAALAVAEPGAPSQDGAAALLSDALRAAGPDATRQALLVYALTKRAKYEEARAELQPLLQATHPAGSLLQKLVPPSRLESEGAAMLAARCRGHSLLMTGDCIAARQAYERALARGGFNAEVSVGLGRAAHDQHDFRAAETAYGAVLERQPAHVGALLGLADTLWERGETGRARQLYGEVVRLSPPPSCAARARLRAAPPTARFPDAFGVSINPVTSRGGT